MILGNSFFFLTKYAGEYANKNIFFITSIFFYFLPIKPGLNRTKS